MRNPNRHGSWIIILVLSLWSFSAAQTAPDTRPLEQGKPIERELAVGELHAYSIQLTAGQFLSAVVEPHWIDVLVTLYDPDGKRIAGGNSLSYLKVAAPVPVTIATNAGGTYQLEIRSLKRDVAPGGYEVKVEELRTATPKDVLRASARQAFAEAWHLHSRDWAETMKARQRFETALALFRSAGDDRGAGSPRVVASLWKVDDAATAELMQRFYHGMLKENLRPAAALRAAKVEMWRQKRWSAPFYWAAF